MTTPKGAHYDLMNERCRDCLVSPRRIVGKRRAKRIIRECIAEDIKFRCHKAQMAGHGNVACRGVHDVTGGDRAFRFAVFCGYPIRLFDAKTLEPMTDE